MDDDHEVRHDRMAGDFKWVRDAAQLHRQGLISIAELYAVIDGEVEIAELYAVINGEVE